MINTKADIGVGKFVNPEYSVTSKPAGNLTDVKFNKKEQAKPKHWVLFAAAAVVGLAVVAYKVEERL